MRVSVNKIEEYCLRSSKKKVVLQIVIGFVIFVLSELVTSLIFDVIFSSIIKQRLPSWVYSSCRTVGSIVVTCAALSFYLKKVIHAELSDCRVGRFRLKPIYVAVAFVLPVIVSLALIASGGTFIVNDSSSQKIFNNVIVALCLGVKAGIVEEIFFRGYVMKFLEAKWSKAVAVLLPSVVFGLLHMMSMDEFSVESLLLLLCAGTAVGAMFSLITIESKSVWSAVVVHAVWNFCMIGRILDISTRHDARSVYSFLLSSENILITGGGFGVESSVVAVVGYVLVILLALYRMKKI